MFATPGSVGRPGRSGTCYPATDTEVCKFVCFLWEEITCCALRTVNLCPNCCCAKHYDITHAVFDIFVRKNLSIQCTIFNLFLHACCLDWDLYLQVLPVIVIGSF